MNHASSRVGRGRILTTYSLSYLICLLNPLTFLDNIINLKMTNDFMLNSRWIFLKLNPSFQQLDIPYCLWVLHLQNGIQVFLDLLLCPFIDYKPKNLPNPTLKVHFLGFRPCSFRRFFYIYQPQPTSTYFNPLQPTWKKNTYLNLLQPTSTHFNQLQSTPS